MLPSLYKRLLLVATAALLGLSAHAPTEAAASSQVKSAYAADSDEDGHVDTITINWSSNAPPGAKYSVAGYRVTRVERARGRTQRLRVAEHANCDVGGLVVLRYRANGRTRRLDMRRFDPPTPRITCAVTLDGDHDSRVDGVRLTYSRSVRSRAQNRGPFLFSVAGYRVTRVNGARGRFIKIAVGERDGTDSSATPRIGYRRPSRRLRRFAVTGGEREGAYSGTYQSTRDGVAPALIGASTSDEDRDGLIDTIRVRFSEPVQVASLAGFGVVGMQVRGAATEGDAVELSLGEHVAALTNARPGVLITAQAIHDRSGNFAPEGAVLSSDGARPVMVAAVASDTAGVSGRIEGVTLRFSEPVHHTADYFGPFPVAVSSRTVTGIDAGLGSGVHVRFVERADMPPALLVVSYLPGHGIDVTDYVGNPAAEASATVADGAASPSSGGDSGSGDSGGGDSGGGDSGGGDSGGGSTPDTTPPDLASATTGDADGDGLIDRMVLRFSETIQHASEAAPASFTVTGYNVTDAGAAQGQELTLTLVEGLSPDTDARPTVNYTPDGTEDVRDSAGNFAPASTIFQATDGARPVPLSAETSDNDDDGRLDAIVTSWSEPLDHPDDTTAPFPISAQGFTVARVRAAVAEALVVDLAEPSAADTGSAPTLTYAGGSDPVRDLNGVEAEQKAHTGLTRDALPPRLVSTTTADADGDGYIDAIDLNWSEAVTGATTSAPYAVSGRTLGASVSFIGAATRVPFTEAASYDTDATPTVSYDAAPGDLHDVAEGPGDTTADTPSVSPQTAADGAPPAIVAAKTADLETPGGGSTPNGTIDAVLTTFSEPIAHSADSTGPFSLNVSGRSETQVEGDDGTATDKTLYVQVAEASSPDGGYKPNVSVTGNGSSSERIKDRASPANDARVMTFTNTSDEVRPVLVSAQLGEEVSGACTKQALVGVDGRVDCVITTWSEAVQHAADTASPFSISSSGWTVDPAGIGALGGSSTLEVRFTPGSGADRDRSGTTVSYDASVDTPVLDEAPSPNAALNGTTSADPACRDTGVEDNDTQGAAGASFALTPTSPAFQGKCAFDDDWYSVQTNASGYLELLARPASAADLTPSLVAAGGATVTPTEVVETGGAGQSDRLKYTGLAPSTTYWIRVTATDVPAPQEGSYCVVFSDESATEAGCGPLAGQIVFTEAGLGTDKFVEIKNDGDVPVEIKDGAAKLVLGTVAAGTRRECTLVRPTVAANATLEPGQHVIVQENASATAFGCSAIPSLGPAGERLELNASGTIDIVDLSGIIVSTIAAEHSLQFVESDLVEDHTANDSVATKWCRTFGAHSKGAVGDGCDEYRINEVLWRPASTAAASDGKAFVEIAGNIPALAGSQLLGGWILRGINGLNGDGGSDFVLPPTASPRSNGAYVIADGVSGATQVSSSDVVWDALDMNSPSWPDGATSAGPRGIQLLMANPSSSPPCTGSADAFGWTTTGQGFSNPLDDLRSCPSVEGQEYTNSTVGSSAARDNLSSAADTSYNDSGDTGNNRIDFCPQATPNPGELNIRPGC